MFRTVTVESLGAGGDGVALAGEDRLYVPGTLPGEVVEIDDAGRRPRLLRVVSPGAERVAPSCRHFGTCGGCALQHMERSAYLAWKRDVVRRSFALHGIEAPVEPVVPVGEGARRRAVFSAVRTADRVILGFHRRASDEIVAIGECPVLAPAIATRLPLFAGLAGTVLRPRKQGRVTVVLADNGLDIALEGGGEPDRRTLAALAARATDPAIARLTLNGVEVLRARRPEISAGGASLLPVPGGFLQAAAGAEHALAEAVLAHVGDAAPVADLFAGIGTFTLRLAARAPVTAVEGDATLLAAIDAGVRAARGLKPVTTRKRDLFVNPLAPAELAAFGAVVFDPPAAGAPAQARAIAASPVPRVVAVSCNPATLARDARILIDGGYRLTRLLPVDQFLYAPGIEVVAAFTRDASTPEPSRKTRIDG